jgi:hypothetical protein
MYDELIKYMRYIKDKGGPDKCDYNFDGVETFAVYSEAGEKE